MAEENAIVVSEQAGFLAPVVGVKEALSAYQSKKDLIDGIMRAGVDYGTGECSKAVMIHRGRPCASRAEPGTLRWGPQCCLCSGRGTRQFKHYVATASGDVAKGKRTMISVNGDRARGHGRAAPARAARDRRTSSAGMRYARRRHRRRS